MGNEDPWFAIALGLVMLLIIAVVIFIPVKLTQLLRREWRRSKKP